MKTLSLLSTAIVIAFCQCSSPSEPTLTPGTLAPPTMNSVDYKRKEIELMTSLAPQLVGEWVLKETQIKSTAANSHVLKEANITKDTTIQNLAILRLKSASFSRFSPVQAKNPEFEGTIQYKSKTYPVYFYLLASPEHIVSSTGPQAFFLFEYNFPNGSHPTEKEESYLQNIGLIDNFSLLVKDGQPEMVWKGLNRGIQQLTLVRK